MPIKSVLRTEATEPGQAIRIQDRWPLVETDEGAVRWDIGRQSAALAMATGEATAAGALVSGVALALAGGVLGLFPAAAASFLTGLGLRGRPAIDFQILVATVGVSGLAGVLCALLAAIQAWRARRPRRQLGSVVVHLFFRARRPDRDRRDRPRPWSPPGVLSTAVKTEDGAHASIVRVGRRIRCV